MRFNRVFAGAAVAFGMLCACSFIVETNSDQCKTTADCTKKGAGFEGYICSGGVCLPEGGCTTNAECIDANNGQPFVCNKTTRSCVNLQVDLGADAGKAPAPCTPYYDTAAKDIRKDETVWVGLVLDTKGQLGSVFGQAFVNYAELARQEIQRSGGIPSATVGGKARPLAFVHCESNGDPDQAVTAANYLADAGIQMFIAGESPTIGVATVNNVFLPRKLLNLGMVSQGVVDIPTGNPPLYYTMIGGVPPQTSTGQVVATEQEVRSRYNYPPSQDVKFLEIVSSNALLTEAFKASRDLAKVNGKTTLENGSNILSISYKETATEGEIAALTQAAVDFKPDFVRVWGYGEVGDIIVPSFDRALAAAGRGPLWVLGFPSMTGKLFQEASMRPELQSRLLWSNQVFATDAARTLASDYTTTFGQEKAVDITILGLVQIPYDTMYLLAHAVAANGTLPLTGENIAKAIPKIFTPGATEVKTGPKELYNGFRAFQPGGSGAILLRGVQAFRGGDSHIELDTTKGAHTYWPWEVLCPISNETVGQALNAPGGLAVPTLPGVAMISGQPTGWTFSHPDYAIQITPMNPGCKKYQDFGKDAGTSDGGGG